MLEWGVTIPQEFERDFLAGKKIRPGTGRKVELFYDKQSYTIRLQHVHRRQYGNVYQLRWDINKDLLRKLRRTFILSYVRLKGQKELFDSNKGQRKFFRGHLEASQQEVMEFRPISSKKIEAKTFIRIEDDWNPLFERLADENVFGWLFEKDKKYLISHSSSWHKAKDFPRHAGAVNVIYYLANTKHKLLYIGKAEILGKRVMPGRKHQNMLGDWDKFRYDIVRQEHANILERIEDHTIRAFASVLKNTTGYSTLGLSNFKLVNKNWKKI